MKNQMSLVAVVAVVAAFALVGCSKGASVTGEGGAKLTLEKPSTVTLARGGMAKADIKIKRHDLAGDVAVHFANLPKGVDVVDESSKIVGDQGSYTLRASETADLVENFSAEVTATAGPGNISVKEPINITVKAKN